MAALFASSGSAVSTVSLRIARDLLVSTVWVEVKRFQSNENEAVRPEHCAKPGVTLLCLTLLTLHRWGAGPNDAQFETSIEPLNLHTFGPNSFIFVIYFQFETPNGSTQMAQIIRVSRSCESCECEIGHIASRGKCAN